MHQYADILNFTAIFLLSSFTLRFKPLRRTLLKTGNLQYISPTRILNDHLIKILVFSSLFFLIAASPLLIQMYNDKSNSTWDLIVWIAAIGFAGVMAPYTIYPVVIIAIISPVLFSHLIARSIAKFIDSEPSPRVIIDNLTIAISYCGIISYVGVLILRATNASPF
jgi:ABC-type uncharacterized transport system permease subunit